MKKRNMKLQQLFQLVIEYKEISDIREKRKQHEVFKNFPEDPNYYTELVREYYQNFDEDSQTDEEIKVHERLEGILRELYYFDTRTMDALIQIAEYASTGKIDSSCGVNPLAAIACKYIPNNKSTLSTEQLEEKLKSFSQVEDLAHNSYTCLNNIKRTKS